MAEAQVLVVPAPTLVEIDQLAQRRNIPGAVAAMLDELLVGAFLLAAPDIEDYARIRELIEQYADLPLGFVDASVVATAERLDEDRVATLDRRDFSVVQPLHCERFTLVP